MKNPDRNNAKSNSARSKRQAGLIDRLLACPVKDFFVPLPSESTRALKPWTSRIGYRSRSQ